MSAKFGLHHLLDPSEDSWDSATQFFVQSQRPGSNPVTAPASLAVPVPLVIPAEALEAQAAQNGSALSAEINQLQVPCAAFVQWRYLPAGSASATNIVCSGLSALRHSRAGR